LITIEEQSASTITPSLRLSVLADKFIADRTGIGRSAGTLETYQFAVDVNIKPRIGGLTVREATPERLQAFLSEINKTRGPGAAKNCRSVLSGMMGLAVRNGAADRNPVRELERITHKSAKGSPAVPLDEVPNLLEAVRADAVLLESDSADLIEFMLGTGWRIGEVCALTEDEVDYGAGKVTMAAVAVRVRGKGVVRQLYGKTDAARRTISVPPNVLELLRRRRGTTPANDLGLVFPTLAGRLRDPSNTERDWRKRRVALGFPTTTTHSFRKTVATALDAVGLSARDIADYLGHKNPSMTQDVYMARNLGSSRAANALAGLLSPNRDDGQPDPSAPADASASLG
jgi:integrase